MASLVKEYAEADAAGRVKLIYSNFSNFLGIIDSRIDGLVYIIENEKATNRRIANGDLGVRIQTGRKSDITGDTASGNVDTKKAIIICDFSGGVLDGTDRGEEFKREAFLLKRMRRDYQLFNDQLGYLDEKDRRLLIGYMSSHDDIVAIADEMGIAADSVRKQVFRTKQKVVKETIRCMEGKL